MASEAILGAPRASTDAALARQIRTCDPFQRAHGPAYLLDRIARVLATQPEGG